MSLKDLARQLADLTWTLEQQTRKVADAEILGYVRDAVTVEVEYRRQMRDLEHRLTDILDNTNPAALLASAFAGRSCASATRTMSLNRGRHRLPPAPPVFCVRRCRPSGHGAAAVSLCYHREAWPGPAPLAA